jgi:5-methylcytosine-specific restriction enzyme A
VASGKWQTSTRKARLPKAWHAMRARVLRRDATICHVCKQPGADSVDHVIAGDAHDEANLAAIHKNPCHARKSSSEGGQASAVSRNARRASRFREPERHPGLTPAPSGDPPTA